MNSSPFSKRVGMAAPSAVGRSPWEFVVVTERATLDRLREGLPYAKMLDKAGAAIVGCGTGVPGADPGRAGGR
jgi:nitroreductase